MYFYVKQKVTHSFFKKGSRPKKQNVKKIDIRVKQKTGKIRVKMEGKGG